VEASTTTTGPVVTAPGNPRVTTTLGSEIEGGQASLLGNVTGPGGGVDGATVRIERLVGDTATGVDVETLPGGGWQLIGVKGGRYRVRAWKAPDLAQVVPEIVFLEATESKTLTLPVALFGQTAPLVGNFDPSPPVVGQPAALAVEVTGSSVDPEGVVRITPRPGVTVQFVANPGMTLLSPPLQVSDSNATVSWRVQCAVAGPVPVSVLLGTVTPPVTAPVAVPPCATAAPPAPPTPTTQP
jgi:hypothetical protein